MTTGRINQVVTTLLSCIQSHIYTTPIVCVVWSLACRLHVHIGAQEMSLNLLFQTAPKKQLTMLMQWYSLSQTPSPTIE